MASSQEVVAAVVVYQPDVRLLEGVLAAIAPQAARILMIVNDDGAWSCAMPANVMVERPGANIGLGAAYNLAVRRAREWGAKRLLLLDQDSVAAPDMVERLARALSADARAAAVGPLWYDSRTGRDGAFVRLSGCRTRHVQLQGPLETHASVAVDFLISSGSLISLDALEGIGAFDEYFFVDHVDTDWSLRASAAHYRLYGVPSARLAHHLGDCVPATFLGRRAFLHAPMRQYYLLRNSILLWRRPYAPWGWVLYDFGRTGLLMIYYLLFQPPRFARLMWMMRGVRDGLRGNGAASSPHIARTQ